MDLGRFIGDIGRNVGNFFGGIFGKNDEDERRRRQQQQQQRQIQPTVSLPLSLNQNTGTVEPPKSFTPTYESFMPTYEPPKIGGVEAKKPQPVDPARFLKESGEFIGSSLQQAGGSLLDAVLQGGEVASSLVNPIVRDPFISEKRKNELNMESQRRLESQRRAISNWTDIAGNRIDNRRTDEAAERASRGQASIQDIAQLVGRATGDASTATMLVNPARTLSGVALKQPRFSQVAPFIAKEAGVYGTASAIEGGGETYGQTGDILQAMQQAGLGFLLGSIPQIGLETAAYGARRAFTGVSGPISRLQRGITHSFEEGLDTPPRIDIPDNERLAPRDPNSPITVSPPTEKPPAITTPNAPQPVQVNPTAPAPVAGGIETPTLQQLERTPQVPDEVARQELERVQKALDEQVAQPAPTPEPVAEVPVAPPSRVEAEALVASTPPVDPATLAKAAKAEAKAQAPTDTPAPKAGAVVEPERTVYTSEAGDSVSVDKDTLESLKQEARKYKNAEEFVKARFAEKPEYGMSHRPTYEGMPPAHNLLDGDVLPRDVYDKPEWSIASGRNFKTDPAARESWTALQKIRNNPDAEITVYRAGAKNELNDGDWITFSKSYAEQSREGTEKVHSFKIKAKDAVFAGDDINEFGYYPKSKYTDLYNQAHAEAKAPKTVEKTFDTPTPRKSGPRQFASDKEVDEILRMGKNTESGSYGKLVVKQSYNSDNPSARKELTKSEQAIMDRLKPQLDAIRKEMNELGLTDDDLGYINYRSDYLPTTRKDELTAVNSVEDVASRDFSALYSRSAKKDGGLSDEQIEEGAEQALRDYLRTGELLKDLSPEQVKQIKLDRRTNETTNLFEKDLRGGSTGITRTDEEIAQSRAQTEKLVEAEMEVAQARQRVDDGDNSPEALAKLDAAESKLTDLEIDKKVDDYILLEKKIDAKIAEIRRDDSITPDSKKQRITQLEAHLADVRNDTYYLQSTVRTNLLLGVGRIADQVNKGVQSISDVTTGRLSKNRANQSFNKIAGRNLYGDKSTTNNVWKKIQSNPRLQSLSVNDEINKRILARQDEGANIVSKGFSAYRRLGTRLTEAGSRYKIANKDTTSYFVAKAQSEGITDVDKIANYVNAQVGSKEWNRVHKAFFDARNTFTGLPHKGNVADKNFRFDPKTFLYNKLGNVPGLSRRTRENIADGLTIPVIGFPKLIYRLGVRGFNTAALGLPDYWKASRIHPKNDAEALQKALYIQSAVRNAQNGAGLGVLGLVLGASGMVTGAYPSKENPNERARWQKDRIQPFSLKVGDQYIDLGRYMGPLAFPIMVGATIGAGRPQDIPATSVALIKQMLHNYGADSIGDVMQDVGSLLNGEGDVGKIISRYGVSVTAALVPTSSLLNTAGKAQDMVQGDAQPDTSGGFTDALRSRFPVIRDGVPRKEDALGNPISQGNALNLLPGVSGGQDTKAKGDTSVDSVDDEIDRLAALGYEVMPTKQNKNANIGINQTIADSLLKDEMYSSLNDEDKAAMLKELLRGSKVKDINKSLPIDQQVVLAKKALLGAEKAEVWLEDTKNARDYYEAVYDNKAANGTLTAKDRDLQRMGSDAYKMIAARVNDEMKATPELLRDYENISKSEFENMPDSPRKRALAALDQARAKAGVSRNNSDKSKPKYGSGSGSGRGRGGKKGFASVQLPESLRGVKGNGGGRSNAEPKQLFKPIPDLQAKPTVSEPKPRSISVKKGIHI